MPSWLYNAAGHLIALSAILTHPCKTSGHQGMCCTVHAHGGQCTVCMSQACGYALTRCCARRPGTRVSSRLQIPGIGRIDANDLDASVVESMRRNIEHNGEVVKSKINPTCSDVRIIMMQNPLVSHLRGDTCVMHEAMTCSRVVLVMHVRLHCDAWVYVSHTSTWMGCVHLFPCAPRACLPWWHGRLTWQYIKH